MSNVMGRQASILEATLIKSEFSSELRRLIGNRYTFLTNNAFCIQFRDKADQISEDACEIYNRLMQEIPASEELRQKVKELRFGAWGTWIVKKVAQRSAFTDCSQ